MQTDFYHGLLGRGFVADDFYMVQTTWSQFLANPFVDFRSEEYDARAEPVPIDHSQPAYMYLIWRETLRQRVLTTLGVSLPEHTFE